jgi:hypothetical protein
MAYLIETCNVLHYRAGHTTERVKISATLPLKTYCINNLIDIHVVTLALQTIYPSIVPK